MPNQTGADRENCVKMAVRRMKANEVTIVDFIFLRNQAKTTTIEHGMKIKVSTLDSLYRFVAT